MKPRIFHGKERIDAVPPDARALAYGDGLFETMRLHGGQVPWWPAHRQRLQEGARRLQLRLPDLRMLDAEVAVCASEAGEGVLKLIVSRGRAARGYSAPDADPLWLLSAHPAPAPWPRLQLRWCDLRLSPQPALAGIKHCARLEQVLARAEWTDPGIHEGLLRSGDGDVVCATAANVFVLHGARWRTPALDRCGVAGVCRGWAIGELAAEEVRLSVADIESADAVFLCNAVRGILDVAGLDARRWDPHPQVAALQAGLARAHPAFVIDRRS